MRKHWILCTGLIGILLISGCSSDKSTGSSITGDVTYTVVFASTWSVTTHPDNFPGNPHFSALIGATHRAVASFWIVDGQATTGIENMAETGGTGALRDEVTEAIAGDDAEQILAGGGIAVSPGTVSLTFDITEDYPLVTLVSMLAPSPDWFVGVSGLNMWEDGGWRETVTITLYVYDAGTDSGTDYTSANADTDPKDPIARLEEAPLRVDGTITPVGTFTFTLQP
jgi:hypothetical protein